MPEIIIELINTPDGGELFVPSVDRVQKAKRRSDQRVAELRRVAAEMQTAIENPPKGTDPDELAIERQARQALQEQINAAPAPVARGYVLKTPKRAMRRFGEEAAAQSAAMAAARAGRTGEVFALVPVGRAVRGAEWREAR